MLDRNTFSEKEICQIILVNFSIRKKINVLRVRKENSSFVSDF